MRKVTNDHAYFEGVSILEVCKHSKKSSFVRSKPGEGDGAGTLIHGT